MRRVLILTFDKNKNNYYLKKMNNSKGVIAFPVLKECNLIGRALRKIFLFKLKNPFFLRLWINTKEIEKKIDGVDSIICMANSVSPIILEYIHRKYNIRCINYYWDKIEVSNYPVKNSTSYENWSFDFHDSRIYNLKYNPQFFVEGVVKKRTNKNIDLFFCGADREGIWSDRVRIVNKQYLEFKKLDLNLSFHMITSSEKCIQEIKCLSPIPQEKYYEFLSNSKAVLEIVEPGHEWLTLRVFDALTNGIKLVTNNKAIKEFDFYNHNNIFIIGIDNDFIEFLATPFDFSVSYQKYSINSWKERFFDE